MKNLKSILFATCSLTVISGVANAAEIDVSCADLGYTVPVSECLEQGSMPLICPVAVGESDSERMSLCYSDSCRGYPLWKENGVYYHLDKNGNKTEAKPEKNTLAYYIKGGESGLESCVTGKTSDARTYYRVKECKDNMILDNDICDEGCGETKYPYDKHPGDLAGAVASCEDAEGEHFGYTSCNDGWDFKNGQCILASCDIKQFPYLGDPNLMNNENRGDTSICRIGGNAYYRYNNCSSQKDAEGKAIYEIKKGICVKRCALKNCTSALKSKDGFEYNDWSCSIDETCRIGDYVTYEGRDIGIIFHLGTGGDDKTLIAGLATTTKKWAHGAYETTDITTITNITNATAAKADYDGKLKTKKIVNFTGNYQTDYPAAAYCYDHNAGCSAGTVCAANEWYLPAEGELGYMFDERYILYNVTNSTTFYNNYFWSSTENSANGAWLLYFPNGNRWNSHKYNTNYVRPVLAF